MPSIAERLDTMEAEVQALQQGGAALSLRIDNAATWQATASGHVRAIWLEIPRLKQANDAHAARIAQVEQRLSWLMIVIGCVILAAILLTG